MMNVQELEDKIKEEKVKLVSLEEAYDKEEDEKKAFKLDNVIDRKTAEINKLIERQQHLLNRETQDEQKDRPKDKNAEEEDEEVCSECGGDLQQIGEENGVVIFECEKCHELFLDE